jgi:DtxR family Mn-dependent transcriptional regulator
METHLIDECLEAIWTCRERGEETLDCIMKVVHQDCDRAYFNTLVQKGMVQLDGESIRFTPTGEKAAAEIIRSHRLAERLLVDVLGLTAEAYEQFACTCEHEVVPEVIDSICTLLGHPSECPHGRPIPPGKCCQEQRREVTRAIMELSEAPIGRELRVAYLRPSHHDRLHLLLSMGIHPGVHLRLHQCTPVVIVQVDHSEFALDNEVAKDICVWIEPER